MQRARISQLPRRCVLSEKHIADSQQDIVSTQKAIAALEETCSLHPASPTWRRAGVSAKQGARRALTQLSQLRQSSVLAEEHITSLQEERTSCFKVIAGLEATRAAVLALLR